MDQQQIEIVGTEVPQGIFRAADDMRAIGNIVTKRVFRFGGGGDAALGDQLHTRAQRRGQPQRGAEGGFTLVVAINIRMIDGGDAQIKMLFNKAHQLLRRHLPFH